jgi:hypothetical protein
VNALYKSAIICYYLYEMSMQTSPTPFSQEASVQTPVLIDERQVGGAVLRGVLCRHGIGDANAIGRTLRDLGVVATEGPLKDEYDRKSSEERYTRIASRRPSWAGYTPLEGYEGNEIAAIANSLVGTGPKTFRLIDIASQSKEWPVYQQSLANLKSYNSRIRWLPKVPDARAACTQLVDSLAASNKAREDSMQPRLENIMTEETRARNPRSVGVVLGLSHLALLTKIGPPVDAEKSALVERRINEIAMPKTLAVIARRNGIDPSSHINRALLSDYTRHTYPHAHNMPAIQLNLYQLSDAKVKQWMEVVDTTIKTTDHEWNVPANLSHALYDLTSTTG